MVSQTQGVPHPVQHFPAFRQPSAFPVEVGAKHHDSRDPRRPASIDYDGSSAASSTVSSRLDDNALSQIAAGRALQNVEKDHITTSNDQFGQPMPGVAFTRGNTNSSILPQINPSSQSSSLTDFQIGLGISSLSPSNGNRQDNLCSLQVTTESSSASSTTVQDSLDLSSTAINANNLKKTNAVEEHSSHIQSFISSDDASKHSLEISSHSQSHLPSPSSGPQHQHPPHMRNNSTLSPESHQSEQSNYDSNKSKLTHGSSFTSSANDLVAVSEDRGSMDFGGSSRSQTLPDSSMQQTHHGLTFQPSEHLGVSSSSFISTSNHMQHNYPNSSNLPSFSAMVWSSPKAFASPSQSFSSSGFFSDTLHQGFGADSNGSAMGDNNNGSNSFGSSSAFSAFAFDPTSNQSNGGVNPWSSSSFF